MPAVTAVVVLSVVAGALPGTASARAAAAVPAQSPSRTSLSAAKASTVGGWSVRADGADRWTATWTSPVRLRLGADRPTVVLGDRAPGLRLTGPLRLSRNGRSVSVTVLATVRPDPEDLDVVLSGRVLDDPRVGPHEIRPRAGTSYQPPARTLLPDDPGDPGPLKVASSDYELPPLSLPGYSAPVEMVGHVERPAPSQTGAPYPLVVFLHGRHTYCYDPARHEESYDWPCRRGDLPVPSQLGYRYVQRTLASQGFVTVSIAANGINAQDWLDADGGAQARSGLLQAHLDHWATEAGQDPDSEVDLDRVVLVGHSRGGEGVARAALEIPLSAPYRVVGQVLVAPTDFSRQVSPYVPTVTVLPYCDGDVVDLQGQTYTDESRRLPTADTALRSSVLVMGANHNYFNTEWTPGRAAAPAWDDWADPGDCRRGSATRLTAAEQRRVGTALIAGATRLFADGDDQFLPLFDGSPAAVPSTGAAVTFSHALGGGRTLRHPGEDARPTEALEATSTLCRGITPFWVVAGLCGRVAHEPVNAPHWPDPSVQTPGSRALEAAWTAPGARAGLALRAPWDLGSAETLELRVVADPRRGPVTLRVRVGDTQGNTALVRPSAGHVLAAFPASGYVRRYWAQSVRVPVGTLTGIDLSRISTVELVGRSGPGRVWLLDLAAAPAALPPVPSTRLPILDLGAVSGPEQDSPDSTLEVPFTLTGDLAEPASFRVYGTDDTTGRRRGAVDVTVPASPDSGGGGSVSGVVEWPTDGDTRDDLAVRRVSLVARALAGVVVRDGEGRVRVLDDDPAPRVSVVPIRHWAREGGRARWRVALRSAVDYPVTVTVDVVRGDAAPRPVSVADLTDRWVSSHVWTSQRHLPLHRAGIRYRLTIPAGSRSVVAVLPLRRDGVREPRESITLRVRTAAPLVSRHRSTVLVRASR